MFKKLLKSTEEKKCEYSSNAKYIYKDVLIKLFSDVIQGKPRKLTLEDVKCSDVVDKWNEAIDVLCRSRRKSVLEVNDLLQRVTRMDSVRDIIKRVYIQAEALHSMSANSEELAASIEEVSDMSQKMSQYSSDTKQASETGLSSVFDSIEAARVGEQGKGFVVVANEVLDLIFVNNCIVTIDAMGTQTKIAEKIIDKKVDYVLALKENQPNLYNDVVDFFEDAERTNFEGLKVKSCTTTDKDHGRIEKYWNSYT